MIGQPSARPGEERRRLHPFLHPAHSLWPPGREGSKQWAQSPWPWKGRGTHPAALSSALDTGMVRPTGLLGGCWPQGTASQGCGPGAEQKFGRLNAGPTGAQDPLQPQERGSCRRRAPTPQRKRWTAMGRGIHILPLLGMLHGEGPSFSEHQAHG